MQIISFLTDQLQHNQIFSGVAGVSMLGGVAYWLRAIPRRILNGIEFAFTSSALFTNDDEVYQRAIEWLEPRMHGWQVRSYKPITGKETKGGLPKKQRSWRSRAVPKGSIINYITAEKPLTSEWIMGPGFGKFWIWHEKWPYRINRWAESNQNSTDGSMRVRENLQITSIGLSKSRLFKMIEQIEGETTDPTNIKIYTFTDSYWDLVDTRSPRPLESVILPEGTMEAITSDIKWFLTAKEMYINRGVPYRRGYLLYGAPGTGKSSTAVALAGHFSAPAYVLSLSSVRSDNTLFDALAQAPHDAFIIIEDIDASGLNVQREGEQPEKKILLEKVTLSGLLNALDGVMAREGRVIIMTTNHIDKLDPALIRPGRIDRRFAFDVANADQAARIFERFFEGENYWASQIRDYYKGGLSPAEIQGICLLHIDDAYMAAMEMVGN